MKRHLRWDWKRSLWRFYANDGTPTLMFLRICKCGAEYMAGIGARAGCFKCRAVHWTVLKKESARAHNAISRAVRKGALHPATAYRCTDCNKPAEVYDHRDYSKQLDVDPVCRGCNIRRGPGKRLVDPGFLTRWGIA